MSFVTAILLAAYFAALALFSLARRSHLGSRALFLLRAFFPSWRFFEDLGDTPALLFRTAAEDSELGEWQPCLGKIPRRWYHLLLNPEGNRLLACSSAIQLLLSDIEEADETDLEALENSVSYRVIQDWVRYRIHQLVPDSAPISYQFKVLAGSDEVLLSPVYGD
jgi:hypothetical protein